MVPRSFFWHMDVSDPPIMHFPSEGLGVWEGYGNGISIFPWFFMLGLKTSKSFPCLKRSALALWILPGRGRDHPRYGELMVSSTYKPRERRSPVFFLTCTPFSFCYRKCWGRCKIEDIINIISLEKKESWWKSCRSCWHCCWFFNGRVIPSFCLVLSYY